VVQLIRDPSERLVAFVLQGVPKFRADAGTLSATTDFPHRLMASNGAVAGRVAVKARHDWFEFNLVLQLRQRIDLVGRCWPTVARPL